MNSMMSYVELYKLIEAVKKSAIKDFTRMIFCEFRKIDEKLSESNEEVCGSDLPVREVPSVVLEFGYYDKIQEIANIITGD